MSVRTDAMDVSSGTKALVGRMAEVDYQYGKHYADVETALKLLVRQIEEAANSIEAAFLRHEIDIAEEMKRRAEERIVELGKVIDQ